MGRAVAIVACLAAPVGGCRADGGSATGGNATTPAPPQGATATGTSGTATLGGGSSGTAGAVPCTESSPGGASPCHCAAPHVAGTAEPPAEGACRPECVPEAFVPLWCLDDGACCSGLCDEATGYCVGGAVTGGTTGVASGGDTGTSTTGP